MGWTGGMVAPATVASSVIAHNGSWKITSGVSEAVVTSRQVSSTGRVPYRLSCRVMTGPAAAMPIENAASTVPAEV